MSAANVETNTPIVKRSVRGRCVVEALKGRDFIISRGVNLFLFSIPEHRLTLPERFDSHFNGNHCGAAQFGVAEDRAITSHCIDPVTLQIPAWFSTN